MDSLALAELRAAALDTGFAPPLFHLAEIAIRTQGAKQAAKAVERFERFGGGTQERRELALMLACANDPHTVDWKTAVTASALEVVSAAKMLSIAGAFPGCVEDATSAILATPTATDYHWGAVIVRQDMLAAQGRLQAVVRLVDSIRTPDFWQPTMFYMIDELAGMHGLRVKVVGETIPSMRAAYGLKYEDSLSTNNLLLIGTWYARSSRIADAERLQRLLRRYASTQRDSIASLRANALVAHILLASGDSTTALDELERLTPMSGLDDLQWGFTAALPVELQTRAELLLTRGRFQEAFDVAAKFDHPTPTVYLAFLPESLVLRYKAARALARPQDAQRFRNRLVALGRTDLLGSLQ